MIQETWDDLSSSYPPSYPRHPAVAKLTARDRQKSDLTAKIETAQHSIERIENEPSPTSESEVSNGLFVAVAATQAATVEQHAKAMAELDNERRENKEKFDTMVRAHVEEHNKAMAELHAMKLVAEASVEETEAHTRESSEIVAQLQEQLVVAEARAQGLQQQQLERKGAPIDMNNASHGSLDLSSSSIDTVRLLESQLEHEKSMHQKCVEKLREAEARAEWAEEETRRLGEDLTEAQAGEHTAKQNFEDVMIEVEGKLRATSTAMEQRIQQSDQQVLEARQGAEAALEREQFALAELANLKESAALETKPGIDGALTLRLDAASTAKPEIGLQTSPDDARWRSHFEREASRRVSAWNELVAAVNEDMSVDTGSASAAAALRSTPRLSSSRLPHRRAFLCERVQCAVLTEHMNAIRENHAQRTAYTGKAEYRAMIQKARTEALDSSEFVDVGGVDRYGRPVVSIPVANLDRSASDLDMVLRSMVWFLDAIVEVDYVLVLFLTERDGGSTPGLSVLQDFHKLLPRSYKKHVKQVFLVHASWQSKVYVNLIRPFVSLKVFKKVVHAETLADLFEHIDDTEVAIPQYVIDADRVLTS